MGQVVFVDGWRQLVSGAVIAWVAGTTAGTRPSGFLPSVLGTPDGGGAGRCWNRGRWQSGVVKQSVHESGNEGAGELKVVDHSQEGVGKALGGGAAGDEDEGEGAECDHACGDTW